MKKLSLIVPCHNEEEMLPLFFEKVEAVLSNQSLELEYLFVNDGSNDSTLQVLKELNHSYPNKVNYLSFSRNFGKEAAIYAGLQNATGDYVTLLDADLQDPPELLIEMLALIEEENYDCIGTRRTSRTGEPWLRTLFAKFFYRLINKISETDLVDGERDFRLMTRQMVDSILEVTEYNRFSRGIFNWVGYQTYYLEFENRERLAGETSWSFWQLFNYSLEAIINFSDLPLTIASFVGLFSTLGALLGLIFIIVRTLVFGDPTAGWPSLVVIILFVAGLQLFALGIIGKYIGKIFLETKNRPLYIIKERSDSK